MSAFTIEENQNGTWTVFRQVGLKGPVVAVTRDYDTRKEAEDWVELNAWLESRYGVMPG